MATYAQIQEYVKEKYGVTVKTCWIADVKAQFGLTKGQAPNRIDSRAGVHPCPEDKKEMIISALEFFGMIETVERDPGGNVNVVQQGSDALDEKDKELVPDLTSLEQPECDLGIGCFIDTETTGLDAYEDEIIELCLILFAFNRETGEIIRIIDEYQGMREPDCSIKRAASKVHGLTKRALKGMSLDESRVNAILEQAEILISHNAKFDRDFLVQLFPLSASKPWYCSMNGINWAGLGYSSKGLQNLLKAHHIKVSNAHRAADDARAVLALLSSRCKDGQIYLRKLLESEPINKGVSKNQGCLTLLIAIASIIIIMVYLFSVLG